VAERVRIRPITDPDELLRLRAAACEMYHLLLRVDRLSLDECSRDGEVLQAAIRKLLKRLAVKP
jgi:hypothetical protein